MADFPHHVIDLRGIGVSHAGGSQGHLGGLVLMPMMGGPTQASP